MFTQGHTLSPSTCTQRVCSANDPVTLVLSAMPFPNSDCAVGIFTLQQAEPQYILAIDTSAGDWSIDKKACPDARSRPSFEGVCTLVYKQRVAVDRKRPQALRHHSLQPINTLPNGLHGGDYMISLAVSYTHLTLPTILLV